MASEGIIDVERLLSELGIEAIKHHDEWIAKCPSGMHEDRHPSWSIKNEPGSFRHGSHSCFSCKYGGGPADLVMTVIGNSLPGALRWLEENCTGPVTALHVSIQVKPVLHSRFSLPNGVVVGPLASWVTPARRYAESRGITAAQVDKWRLGYCVEGRLAGRIVFPIYDFWGRLLSYSARTFVDSPKRYLTPDVLKEGSDTGAIWGEHLWPKPEERDEIVVIEGSINGLAVDRICDLPLGGLQGSKLQLSQLLKLSSFKNLILMTDPDYAGDTAAKQYAESFQRHSPVYRVQFRPKTDAASIPEEELRCLIDKRKSTLL